MPASRLLYERENPMLVKRLMRVESGRRESNPRSQLGNPIERSVRNAGEQKAQVIRLDELRRTVLNDYVRAIDAR